MALSWAALALIVASSLAWSGLDLTRKLLAARMGAVPLLFLLTLGPLPLLIAWAVATGGTRAGAGYFAPALASVALNVVANLAFLRSMQLSPLSMTIPLLSLTPVFTTLLAVPILGELPGPRQLVGILLVVVGAVLLTAPARRAAGGAWQPFRIDRGSMLMAGVALFWSVTPPFDKLALQAASAPLHATVLNAGVAVATLGLLLAGRRLGELRALRHGVAAFVGSIVFSAVGLGLQLMAMRVAMVGFVETLKRGIGCVMAVLLGRLVLREPVGGRKLAAIAAMAAGVALILLPSRATPAASLPLAELRLPPGFVVTVYASGVPGARQLTASPAGIVYAGSRGGSVYALPDRDRDGRADAVHTVARGLQFPNGVAWRDGALYVAEIPRLLRLDGIDERLALPPKPAVVYGFPRERHHGWKFIAFGPDGRLYIPVGAPCNVCDPPPPFARLSRLAADGKGLEVFASGVRNTVGFDWHPETRELWFTDNGRDWMGEDRPPDELNRAPRSGLHFGYPYCHGRDLRDPELGKGKDCGRYVPPERELGPHVAALGMTFYTGTAFPEPYRGQIFIAEHGSWNRRQPIGYRITLVRLRGGRTASYEVFAEGWLRPGGAWGRPVDVMVMPDGALLVSDDHAGAIYRIAYGGR